MKISTEHRDALNEALDETAGYEGDVYVFNVKHIEILRSAVIAMLEDDEQTTTVAPAVDAQPVAWTKDLSKWLRGEAGRHMASIAPKGATITSHALQLKLWADQIDGYTSAQSEGLRRREAWISVDERLPKCSRTKGSMGVEVLVWPRKEGGEATAFYGRRVTDTPAFYRYGAVINHVTHWQPLPAPPAALSQKAGEQS